MCFFACVDSLFLWTLPSLPAWHPPTYSRSPPFSAALGKLKTPHYSISRTYVFPQHQTNTVSIAVIPAGFIYMPPRCPNCHFLQSRVYFFLSLIVYAVSSLVLNPLLRLGDLHWLNNISGLHCHLFRHTSHAPSFFPGVPPVPLELWRWAGCEGSGCRFWWAWHSIWRHVAGHRAHWGQEILHLGQKEVRKPQKNARATQEQKTQGEVSLMFKAF